MQIGASLFSLSLMGALLNKTVRYFVARQRTYAYAYVDDVYY